MIFKIEIHREALKFLMKIDKKNRTKIIQKIKELAKDPFPKYSLKIKGWKEKLYRIRVGEYRILYYVDESTSTIFIFKVDKRSRVYKK